MLFGFSSISLSVDDAALGGDLGALASREAKGLVGLGADMVRIILMFVQP